MGNDFTAAVVPARAGWRCFRVTGLVTSSARSTAGFTIVELLTVLTVLAVLATLVAAFVANARVQSQQTVCIDNLQQVNQAIQMYTKDSGRRPRSLSRVIQSRGTERSSEIFICPADPALRRASEVGRATNFFWGNFVNETQEPWGPGDLSLPESGSWTAELAEVNETEPFSYLHPLAWRRSGWQRLASLGTDTGIAICQLHGVRLPASVAIPNRKNFLQYEGQIFRAQRDGAVVSRKVFRPGATGDKPAGTDYPWEFYTDAQTSPAR